MGVSYDLISEFVKITNDKKDDKKEGTVYATVVSGTEGKYVRIDGSDLLTPTDTTTDIEDGERVTLMIKDHKAIVTGNVTTPSASTTKVDKVAKSVNSVSDRVGTFELVVADKVSTKELEAYKANIEILVAKKATIEDLTATNATIENLKVKDAEIEHAVVENLKATTADINTLNADFARIKTLVNGNLTSDNILSFNLTSGKVTVDDAFIKDAMIDTISAGKINAGEINTNLVSIGSEDGGMLITGSTQRFTDKNGNVRIQIGKDASGDFTFVLYGEDGTGQIINQNGITASAIGDGLIVNNMVSDNAAIAGGKLDISSVITEINGDTSTTIKSSKIYLNEQQQSLEVAFNSLKTKVDTIQQITVEGDLTAIVEQVQSNTTKIEANTESISTLISEDTVIKKQVTDLEGTLNETETTLTSQYTSLNQSLEGFKTTVADTYATKSSVTDVVDNLSANYSTTSVMNSAIEQKAQEISASVSSTYTTKNEVNTLTQQMESAINVAKDAVTTTVSNLRTEVMSASYNNLLWNSDFLIRENNFPKGYHSLNRTYCFGSGWTCPSGGSTITIDTSGGGVNWQGFTSYAIRVQQYQTLTASIYVAIDNEAHIGSVNFGLEIEWLGADGNRISASGGAFVMGSIYNWERHSATGTAPEGTVYARIYCWNEYQGVSWWGEPMLQFGSVMTAWTRGGDLEGINERISYAEQKITDDAITNTVRQNFYTKEETNNQITSQGYATTSQVQQTVDNLQIKFSENGGYNLLHNGGFENGTNYWSRNGNFTDGKDVWYPYGNGTSWVIWASESWTGFFQFFECTVGKRYSWSMDVYVESGAIYVGADDKNLIRQGASNGWVNVKGTITATATTLPFCIYSSTEGATVHIDNVIVNEGEIPLPYSPHPSEIYDGITTIDKDGINVATSYGAHTQFHSGGMSSYNNSNQRTLGIENGGVSFHSWNNNALSAYITQSSLWSGNQSANGLAISTTANGTYLALGISSLSDVNTTLNMEQALTISASDGFQPRGINFWKDVHAHGYGIRQLSHLQLADNGAIQFDYLHNSPSTIYEAVDNGHSLYIMGGYQMHLGVMEGSGTPHGVIWMRGQTDTHSYTHWDFHNYTMYNMKTASTYANVASRKLTESYGVTSNVDGVRYLYRDVELIDGKAIRSIPNGYKCCTYDIVSIVCKGRGSAWVETEDENRFEINGDCKSVNIEIIIYPSEAVMMASTQQLEEAPTLELPKKTEPEEALLITNEAIEEKEETIIEEDDIDGIDTGTIIENY